MVVDVCKAEKLKYIATLKSCPLKHREVRGKDKKLLSLPKS